jgi:hypothetical protein
LQERRSILQHQQTRWRKKSPAQLQE